jgi:hypothetical protein
VATPQETIDGLLSAVDLATRANLPPLDRDALLQIVHRDSLAALGLS